MQLTAKKIAELKAMPKEELAAWLAKGRPAAKVRIDWDANVTFWAPMLRGVALEGRFETEDEAMAAANEFRKEHSAKGGAK